MATNLSRREATMSILQVHLSRKGRLYGKEEMPRRSATALLCAVPTAREQCRARKGRVTPKRAEVILFEVQFLMSRLEY